MSIRARFQIKRQSFHLDVDLDVPARGVIGLYGPSGCGKTTLLRAMAGLEKHAGGILQFENEIWQDGSSFMPPHERSLGYVFQEASLFSHLSVSGNIEFGLKRLKESERRVSLQDAVDLLGIGHLLHRKPMTLSGGERQRVAIARALAVSPGLLVMDEPLAALDEDSKAEILPYLESLHSELDIPLIYVSHRIEEIARLADHLILMEKGRVLATGPIDDMLTRLDLPLAHSRGASSVVEALVAGHDDEFHLTRLDFPGGRFSVPKRSVAPGDRVRLRLAARDVSLTLERQSGTSIQNIFPATVEALSSEGQAQVTVRLRLGGCPVLSRVTQKSASELDLRAGKELFAQVKSVVLLT